MSAVNKSWAQSILLGLLLIAWPFILFWQIWWPDANQRRVFAYSDFITQYYPFRAFVASELSQGRLPLWDPYTFSGYPAVAESLHATFYPLGLWQVFFPQPFPIWALQIEAIFHLGLAGVFTCLFVRQLTHRTDAGLLAGVAFSCSGFLTSYPMLQLLILEAAVWLPASLWLLELALLHHSLRLATLVGVVLGCSLLAGHPQTSLYIAFVIGSYLLIRTVMKKEKKFALTTLLLSGSIALGLSAAQWLPSIKLIPHSPRASLSYEQVSGGFQLAELWGLVRPNPGQWSPLYVGLVPLILAFISLLIARRKVWFWWAVVIISLLLSLGRNGFLYPLVYALAPSLALFRNQERVAFVTSFALIVLAGYGYSLLAKQKWWPSSALPILLGLTVLDLFHANQGTILQIPPPEGYFASTSTVQYLQQNSNLWRVSSEALLPGGGNAGKVFQIRDVTGNSPLHLSHYDLFFEIVPEVRWWQLLNVRYVLTRRVFDYPGIYSVLEDKQRSQRLYQLDLGGQPVWITHAFQVVPDQSSAFWLTSDLERLDPLKTAVLEEQPIPLPESTTGQEAVRVVIFENQRMEVETTLSTPGILVFSEIDYPGWKAWANGRRIKTLRAFGMLRAVALPAGSWKVEWRYEPLIVRLGLGLSGFTLLSVGLIFLWRRKILCKPQRKRENQ